MQLKHNHKAFTMVEVVAAIGIMTLVVASSVAMMLGSMRCYDMESNRTYTDTDAVFAMQKIVSEVREAHSVDVSSDHKTLTINTPKIVAGGYYDRKLTDPNTAVQYYLSNSTGVPGCTGTWLWRKKANEAAEVMKKNVVWIFFEQDIDAPSQVKITINTQNDAHSELSTELTERVVYLRNN